MFKIEVHNRIHQLFSMFRFIGLWQSNDTAILRKWLPMVHLILYSYFPISLAVGAYTSKNNDEASFLAVLSIVAVNLSVRMYYILWKKDEIHELTRDIGTHTIKEYEEYNNINNRIEVFIKFWTRFQFMVLCSVLSSILIALPIFTSELILPLNFYFPLNWKQSKIMYWMGFTLVVYELIMSYLVTFFNGTIWYLMMCCATRYETLGNELRCLGSKNVNETYSCKDGEHSFVPPIFALIQNHQNLHRYITLSAL